MIINPSVGKMAHSRVQPLWWWILFLFWLIFFFPAWYRLSYTKLRELRAAVGGTRNQQLTVLHDSEDAAQLLLIRDWVWKLQSMQDEPVVVAVPDEGEGTVLPLLHNRAILRSLMGGAIPIRTVGTIQPGDSVVLLPVVREDLSRLQMQIEQLNSDTGRITVIPLEVLP